MIGIFVGDCVGSRFEWENIKTKEFELFAEKSYLTDDSIMTLAIAEAILNAEKEHGKLSLLAIKYMQKLGRLYPVGYGTTLENGSPQTIQNLMEVLEMVQLCASVLVLMLVKL
jgi:ADP-ribosylglycohydrolase